MQNWLSVFLAQLLITVFKARTSADQKAHLNLTSISNSIVFVDTNYCLNYMIECNVFAHACDSIRAARCPDFFGFVLNFTTLPCILNILAFENSRTRYRLDFLGQKTKPKSFLYMAYF